MSEPLAIMWHKSIETGEIPELFKMPFVIPIDKPYNLRSQPGSYHRVSLTSHLVKTFEHVVEKSLLNFLEVTLALRDGQHDFRASKSCLREDIRKKAYFFQAMSTGGVQLESKNFEVVLLSIILNRGREEGVDHVPKVLRHFLP